MKYEFAYVVKNKIEFTGAELALVFQCSQDHYDLNCIRASQSQGFIWRMVSQMMRSCKDVEFNIPQVAVRMTKFQTLKETLEVDSNQIDLMKKMLEQSRSLPAANELATKLFLHFKANQREHCRLNNCEHLLPENYKE